MEHQALFWAHETACVDDPAGVGERTRVWHFAHIMKGAVVGKDCSIGQNVFIGAGAVVGDGVKIQNNVSVYDRVTLEDHVFCGPSMVFTNVINPRSHISRKQEYRATLIRQGATLGANATILCGLTIGRFAFIGAGAVVTRDVSDFALITGNPGRQQGWVCRCGVKLLLPVQAGRRRVACRVCKATYRGAGSKLIEGVGE
ncbi:MAG: N-acetyltransferase [Nitrospira sp.]|nr:N-acetyltransferase [Nitrospira sp.]